MDILFHSDTLLYIFIETGRLLKETLYSDFLFPLDLQNSLYSRPVQCNTVVKLHQTSEILLDLGTQLTIVDCRQPFHHFMNHTEYIVLQIELD